MPDSDVRILLNFKKWNKDELLLLLTQENRGELFANANIPNPFENVDDVEFLPQEHPQNILCPMCLQDTAQEVNFGALSDLYNCI